MFFISSSACCRKWYFCLITAAIIMCIMHDVHSYYVCASCIAYLIIMMIPPKNSQPRINERTNNTNFYDKFQTSLITTTTPQRHRVIAMAEQLGNIISSYWLLRTSCKVAHFGKMHVWCRTNITTTTSS
jgi:hypothetical protein